MVTVQVIDNRIHEVTVEDRTTTTHRVTVDASYQASLGWADHPAAALVERSFEFLLEREPNTSILGSFDLSVIEKYFPEYKQTMQALVKK